MLQLLCRVAVKMRDSTGLARGGSLKKVSPGGKKLISCLGENAIIKGGIGLSAFLKILSSSQTVSTSVDLLKKGRFRLSSSSQGENKQQAPSALETA